MQPLVIDYLRTHSFQELEDQHGVKARFSADGSKVSLNYDQLLIKGGDKLAEQCRGLVVRPLKFDKASIGEAWKNYIVRECQVVAWPMDRFYNEGDPFAAQVDWSTARIEEKLDGTCCIVYYDDVKQEWHVATRSVPEADLPFNDWHPTVRTFRDLFFHAAGADLFDNLQQDFTYVFEVTSPLNRIVVKYDDYRATVLTMRHTVSGVEYACYSLKHSPKIWNFNTIASLADFVNAADPAQLEGAVVVDANFNRLKVKSKAWVMASRAKDFVTTSPRNALECIISGKQDDIKPLVEDAIKRHLEDLEDRLAKYDRKFCESFTRLKENSKGDRKSFALAVLASGEWQTPYFAMLNKQNEGFGLVEWLRLLYAAGKLTDSLLDTLLGALK